MAIVFWNILCMCTDGQDLGEGAWEGVVFLKPFEVLHVNKVLNLA